MIPLPVRWPDSEVSQTHPLSSWLASLSLSRNSGETLDLSQDVLLVNLLILSRHIWPYHRSFFLSSYS